MNFNAVLRAFRHPRAITVHDCVGRRLPGARWAWGAEKDGQWTEGGREEREIRAIVLAASPRNFVVAAEGGATESRLALFTAEELHYPDLTNQQTGPDPRQSYLFYQGQRYRVVGGGLLFGNTNMRQYEAARNIR